MNPTELPGGQINGGDAISAAAAPSPDLATPYSHSDQGSEILWASICGDFAH
jgi:hypothetical protein